MLVLDFPFEKAIIDVMKYEILNEIQIKIKNNSWYHFCSTTNVMYVDESE